MKRANLVRLALVNGLIALLAPPAFAAEPPIAPRLGPPFTVSGPQEIPNIALRFAPKTREDESEATHEGPEYWAARKEAEERRAFEMPPPEMRRAIAAQVYAQRSEERQSRTPLASAGWRSLGPTQDAGRVSDYAFTADGSRIYVATSNGGLWRLTRQGGPGSDYGSPQSLTDDLPLLTFGAVAVAPSNPNIVYAATGEASHSGNVVAGFGTLLSTDGGNTWSFNTQSVTGGINNVIPSQYSYKIDVNPNDPADALLGTENGIFRTRDYGRTWVLKLAAQNPPYGTRQGCNLARRAGNANVVWAGLWGGLGFSTDGGETWQVIFEDIATQVNYPGKPGRSLVVISASNPNRLYWLVAGTRTDGTNSQVGIFRSDDGGNNWGKVLGEQSPNYQERIAGSQGWGILAIAVDPTNPDRVIAGGLDTWRSEDGGLHWTRISQWTLPEHHPQFCHADIRTLAFEPGLPNYWVGSDGGLFRSIDSGRTYIWKNDGVVVRMFSSLAQHPTDPYRLYAGTQDNGTNRLSANNPAAWKRIFYGDGYDCLVNPLNPSIVYATNYNNYTSRADDGGETEDSFHGTNCPANYQKTSDCTLKPVTTFRSRLAFDPVDPRILYAMTDQFYATSNGASDPSDWKPVYGGYFCGEGYSTSTCTNGYAGCTSISVNPADRRQVAFGAGSSGGQLFVTLDGFGHTATLNIGVQVNAILWDPLVANALYIGLESAAKLGNSSSGHTIYWISNLDTTPVFYMADNGIGVPITYAGGSYTWFSAVDSLAVSPRDGNLLFAGTKYGIFRSTDGAVTWSRFGTDLPATWVSALLFSPDGARIRAATWGRGLWEANPLGGAIVGTAPPTAAFTFSPSTSRPGQTIAFNDQSSNGATSWNWNFGDGGTSAAQNPTHVFVNPGTFNVTLTVSNAAGSNSVSHAVVVSYGTTGTGSVFAYLLPVVLSNPGVNDTFFTAEVTLTNRSGRAVNLTFRTVGTFAGTATYVLQPGQLVIPEIYAFLAQNGMAVPAGNKVTTLRIEVSGADNLSQFGALARVTTPATAALRGQGVTGRFGLAFTAKPLGRAASNRAIVFGLQQTADPPAPGTRSNLACVHAGSGSGGPIQLEITYHDGDTGQDHPTKSTLNLSAFQFAQENQPLAARGIRNGYALVRKVSGDDQFTCYGALNDNVTGDGAFDPMVIDDQTSPTSFAVVPVVLETDTFKSEATLANRTARTISGLFAVLPSGDPTPQWGYFNLDPGAQVTLPNIIQALRDVGFVIPPNTVASLVFQLLDGAFDPTTTSDTLPSVPTTSGFVGIRTYTVRAGGLLGLAYGYTPVGGAADTEAYVYGLQQTGIRGQEGGTRSNMAVVHSLGGQVQNLTLEVTYYGPNGQELGKEPACNPCTLQPGEWRQFNAPLSPYGVPHGYARVRRLAGTDQFLAYGVLNDQANDDGSYVPMVVP
jgi:hypothetical protein